ncbi:MAG TPA: hypothetical protein PL017_12450 [Tenuifilaceae bacterium]|nr:hypothetical protein [Tenuifilaceae bacterium]HPE19263.1 hypothetical protein [Tenuifilaceae bacterium]HPJ46899.1 hypothetical protein [Tenuifilaceae bacterium]HPQ35370.1 hypothetical protein [Tenuifilaceae bacterium]HRX69115.1 hypothetical protein [Tenuifilaceae bacterium]
MKRFASIITFLLAASVCLAHPVHLTVTNVEIDTNTGKGTVFFKIFSIDLQDAVSQWKGFHLDIDELLSNKDKTEWIHQYINNNFSISDSKKVQLTFTESKMDGDYVRLSYVFEIGSGNSSVDIFNSLLLDLLPDQSNLVIVTINGKDKGLNFNAQNRRYSVELKRL